MSTPDERSRRFGSQKRRSTWARRSERWLRSHPRRAHDPAPARRCAPCRTRAGCSPTTTRAWTALGLALTSADLVGDHARRARRDRRVRRRTPPVRRAHRLLPGRAAPPRRSALSHGGIAQRRAARVVGRRQPRARRRARRGRVAKAYCARARAPCARPPSRCTAGSATPGSASPTCTCAGRCSRRSGSATTAHAAAATLAARSAGGEPMDFRDSPAEAEFRAPPSRLARRQQPRACRRRRPTTSTGRARPSGTRALRRRLLRAELADALRRARPPRRCST